MQVMTFASPIKTIIQDFFRPNIFSFMIYLSLLLTTDHEKEKYLLPKKIAMVK